MCCSFFKTKHVNTIITLFTLKELPNQNHDDPKWAKPANSIKYGYRKQRLLENRVMMVEAAQQCVKDRKDWRALVYM